MMRGDFVKTSISIVVVRLINMPAEVKTIEVSGYRWPPVASKPKNPTATGCACAILIACRLVEIFGFFPSNSRTSLERGEFIWAARVEARPRLERGRQQT